MKKKIGSAYLKPVLQVCDSFDDIHFENLPEKFIIKANHGCKWNYKIKNKEKFLENTTLFEYVKGKFKEWLGLSYGLLSGFEMQYKNIEPKIIIEPLLCNDDNEPLVEYEIYCFNQKPQIYQKIKYSTPALCSVYDKNFEHSDIVFNSTYNTEYSKAEDTLKWAVELSKKLCSEFKFVRIDWILHNNQLYFNEMTFTPFSGFCFFQDEKWDFELGKMLNIKKDTN